MEPKTGSIVNYYVIDTSMSKTATKKLTQEQALQLAINELAEIAPAGTGELLLLQPGEYDESTNQYAFHFVRQEQGKDSLVYTLPGLFDVKIDALTGEIYSSGSTE
ncbi:YcdB/YcdC domain-containing protein [Brevibacillus porteri]|uniref:YcdB/YcdC domain-containing protein n=1 Tax=Brevibacillus porteri TaxID=2126350 RepID=UPI00370B15FE